MYTLVLMATLASGGASPSCGHEYGFRGYSGNIYHWNGDGGDWYPSSAWYGGTARGLNAWGAYASYVNGANTPISFGGNGYAGYSNWNGYFATFIPATGAAYAPAPFLTAPPR